MMYMLLLHDDYMGDNNDNNKFGYKMGHYH